LRTYAAWVAEADQRAAGTLDEHMRHQTLRTTIEWS
jgi:predicted ATPase